MKGARILHVRPDKGGIADYGIQIEAIYAEQGAQITPFVIMDANHPSRAASDILERTFDIIHFEIGAGDSKIFDLCRRLAPRISTPIILTIHDTGIVVRHPVYIELANSKNMLLRVFGKILRKLTSVFIGKSVIAGLLSRPTVTPIYLRSDLADERKSYHLPQPTYHKLRQPLPKRQTKPMVAFSGYWGLGKGIETLLESWGILEDKTNLRLSVSGATGSPDDAYYKKIMSGIKALGRNVSTPGFIPAKDLDQFLQNLSAIVLPYWSELPNGASAMSMRAAELGVPIIASDVPSLKEQLGPDGAFYVEPKNAQALAEAIKELDEDPIPFIERAKITQDMIYQSHNWEVVGKKLSSIIAIISK